MCHPLSRLALALHDDVLHLGVRGTNEKLRTVEAHASKDLDGLDQESWMKHWLGKVEVAKVPRALGHVAGASQTPRDSVDNSLVRVHESTELRPATLVDLREANAAVCDRHPPNLVRAEDPELDAPHGAHRCLGVPCVDIRHGGALDRRRSRCRA